MSDDNLNIEKYKEWLIKGDHDLQAIDMIQSCFL